MWKTNGDWILKIADFKLCDKCYSVMESYEKTYIGVMEI